MSATHSEQYDLQDFRRMVKINEDIKQVVQISGEVNLAALNAMFIAKKAGEVARGFGVVSGELRAFSKRLEDAMNSLTRQVFVLLGDVSAYGRQWRNYSGHLQAASHGAQARHYLEATLLRLENNIHRSQRDIVARQQQLIAGVGQARKLCNSGLAIARSAKIEAVYGQQMAGGLRHVAEEVEQAVTNIVTTLKGLELQLAG